MSGQGKPLLVELRTEELPPLLLGDVAAGFAAGLVKALADARLRAPDAAIEHWSTPRRVAALLQGVAAHSAAATGVRRGPSVKNAYGKDGEPTKALAGFLQSSGAKREDLQEVDYKGQPYVAVPQSGGGEPLGKLLGPAIERAVAKTVAPRLMRWGDTKHRFVRPIRSVCAIHGDQPVETAVFGKQTLPHTFGHRFLAPGEIKIEDASSYVDAMRKGKIMVDAAERRAAIREQAKDIAPQVRIDEGLLFEIVNMCEWPKCYLAGFDSKYQALPVKVVETCMGKHLRSFAVGDEKNLANEFVFVADNEPVDAKPLRHNLERVMRARLDDTLFIYEKDLKSKPEDLLNRLDDLNYLKGMGSMNVRCQRIKRIASSYAHCLKLEHKDLEAVANAAEYIKADLATLLGDEYPGLEGHIGAALLSSLPDASRDLIRGHIDRKLDEVPNTARDALVLALEFERLVTVTAISGLPKGSSDPRGLRRSMGRVLRILQRHPGVDFIELLRMCWEECLDAAIERGAFLAGSFNTEEGLTYKLLRKFACERLKNMAGTLLKRDVARRTLNAISANILDNCDERQPLIIADILNQIASFEEFAATNPELHASMVVSAKRLDNITNQLVKSIPENIELLNKDLNRKLDEMANVSDIFVTELAQPIEIITAITNILEKQLATRLAPLPEISEPLRAPQVEQLKSFLASSQNLPDFRLAERLAGLSRTISHFLDSFFVDQPGEWLNFNKYLEDMYAQDFYAKYILPVAERLDNNMAVLIRRIHETVRQWGKIIHNIQELPKTRQRLAASVKRYEENLEAFQQWKEKVQGIEHWPAKLTMHPVPDAKSRIFEQYENAVKIAKPIHDAAKYINDGYNKFKEIKDGLNAGSDSPHSKEGRQSKENRVLESNRSALIENSSLLNDIAKRLEFGPVKEDLLKETAEKNLYEACKALKPEADKLLEQSDYVNYYRLIAGLTPTIEEFFDNVMVDTPGLRQNRFNLIGMAARLLNATLETRSLYA